MCKTVFFTAYFVHNFAVNGGECGEIMKFTARGSGELTKIHHISPLTTDYRPCTGSNLSTPTFHPLLFHCAKFQKVLGYLF